MYHIINDPHRVNWGGVAFVVMLATYLLTCAFGTHLIRRWGMRPKRFRMKRRNYGFTGSTEPAWDKTVDRDFMRQWTRLPERPPFLIPDPTASLETASGHEVTATGAERHLQIVPKWIAPSDHEHCIDIERSRLKVMEGGAILAQCCVSGCDEVVMLGRNVAHAIVENATKAAVS